MVLLLVYTHRSSLGHRPSSGGPAKKRTRTEEQGSCQASRERVVPPKKRKALQASRSKRATSPSIINNDEWAMLEREEEEQPLRHGKGQRIGPRGRTPRLMNSRWIIARMSTRKKGSIQSAWKSSQDGLFLGEHQEVLGGLPREALPVRQ